MESARNENECLGAEAWREIAAGLMPPEQTLACIEHASGCESCGPQFREAVAEASRLNAELTEAEQKQVASLASARVEWQQRLARQIAAATASERRPSPQRSKWLAVPRLAMAGAALLALVGVGIWVVGSWIILERKQVATATRLLARAYSEQRTLELRMGDATYAPLRISRGPADSFTSRPPALLKAEALIASQLETHPSDASWLQAKARADVLEGKYDAAIEALRRAVELQPGSPALLADLATAYFQRARTENDRAEDFGTAYEYLSQALKIQPDDAVALFNRAIVAEHESLYRQALDDWEHYLRLDSGSAWAGEARERAEAVRDKLKEHGSVAAPLLAVDQVAAISGRANSDSEDEAEIDSRVGEYLHQAVLTWLPEAFPEARARAQGNEAAQAAASQALFFLAELTSRQHGDGWLSDLLRGSGGPQFPQAVAALARAVKANDSGDNDVSRQQSAVAEKWFRASGNMAGALRAQFEQTFAAQVARQSEACRQQATTALALSEKYPYPWLQIQLGLEKAVCSTLRGDIGADEKATGRALDRAQKSGFEALYLRAVLFAAEDKRLTGDRAGASALVSRGLERYWSGQFPAVRGYSLYVGLANIAEAAKQPNLQVASLREAVAVIDSDDDLMQRALAHNRLADAATAAHLPNVAERQYGEAARLLAAAPRTEGRRNDALETAIRTARLEVQLGRFEDAIVRLTAIQEQIRPLSNQYLAQMFYSTLGELQLSRHREVEAEQALRPALDLAEQSLATLRSEPERANWSKDAAPAYLALTEAELAQGRSEEALETYEWYLGAPQRETADSNFRRLAYRPGGDGAYEATSGPPTRERSRLAAVLPLLARETVIAYAVLPDGLAIWIYDDRGINTRWIPQSTTGLQELAERFHDLSSDPQSELSALRRDARSLYGLLIAPVEQSLAPGRTLVIEAPEWLARVPFEALLDANDHYLIERSAVVHSLGQDSQARLRSDALISADLPALVVGSTASSPSDGLIPLPDVAREAEGVGSWFKSPQILKGGEATLTRVQNELPSAAVFHFAGHSLATSGRTGLLLQNEDGRASVPRLLDAAEVRQLRLRNLQLAVLSACGTASESGGSGGFDSIGDALLGAGVPHVVASRWPVDSAEAREFVQDFYHNALSGQTVSEAVRLTSRKMLSNPRTVHPYYWSAFAAYGRP